MHDSSRLYEDSLSQVRNGDTSGALHTLGQLLATTPNHLSGRKLHGLLLAETGDTEGAIGDFDYLIARNPEDVDAFYNRGTLHVRLRQLVEAVNDFAHVTSKRPHDQHNRANHARALIELEDYPKAIDVLQAGLDQTPQHGEFLNLMGLALNHLGQLHTALKCLQLAREQIPEDVDTLHNLGLTADDLGQPEMAIEAYDAAAKCCPDIADIRLCRGFSRLMLGQFAKAWPDIRARTHTDYGASILRHDHLPAWNGESLGETPLIIHAEQGYGDTFLFCRFIAQACKRTPHVIVEAPAPTLRLLRSITGPAHFTDNASHITGHQCSMLDLPAALGLDQDTIAPTPRYLVAPNNVQTKWAAKLPCSKGLKVGLFWQGRTEKRRTPQTVRSVPLDQLLKALPDKCVIVPLQKDISEADKKHLSTDRRIHAVHQDIEDFADTAAICEHMDIIISIDSGPANLALALGRPTCMLLPFAADWRWMLTPKMTPWYPTATLFRQTEIGDWSGPLSALQQHLTQSFR